MTVGCGGDDGSGDTGSLVEQLLSLEMEQAMLECPCEPDKCVWEGPSAAQQECIEGVVARHAAQIESELRCEVSRVSGQNDCYAGEECTDTEAWELCYDAGGDCDDSYTESIEDELDACEGLE